MINYIDILKTSALFTGLNSDEIYAMLNCLGAKLKHFEKGTYVLRAGESVNSLAILIYGKLHIQKDDYWGNRSIINVIEKGEMFGEAYATPDSGAITNDVTAIENSSVIFFDIKKILSLCPSNCKFHSLIIRNLFYTIAKKNRLLVSKLAITSKRTTREKLIAYLSEEAKKQKRSSFEIPFNRQQLADFLSVDRSAMSNELCKMRDDGIIEFHKNKFTLIDIS